MRFPSPGGRVVRIPFMYDGAVSYPPHTLPHPLSLNESQTPWSILVSCLEWNTRYPGLFSIISRIEYSGMTLLV